MRRFFLTLVAALALTTMTTVIAQDRRHFVPFADDQDYRSQHPTALAVEVEADAFMQRVNLYSRRPFPSMVGLSVTFVSGTGSTR